MKKKNTFAAERNQYTRREYCGQRWHQGIVQRVSGMGSCQWTGAKIARIGFDAAATVLAVGRADMVFRLSNR